MDADHLLKAQSEAVIAACACLAAAYEAPFQTGPRPWLELVSLEFLNFARARRLIEPPEGAWLGIRNGETSTPDDKLAAEVGLLSLAVAGNFDRQAARRTRQSISATLRILSDEAPSVAVDPITPAPGEPSASESTDLRGLLAAPLHSRGERVGLLLGGLLLADGSANPVADDDPLLAAVFAAIARAASDRIMETHIRRRGLLSRFTPVQRRVLTLMGDGLTEREIAQKTETSPHTVHDHISTIYRSLDVHSRIELLDVWHGRRDPAPPPTASTPAPAPASPTASSPPRR